MPEQMRVCFVCSAECVREFWSDPSKNTAPMFITADGKEMDKYIVSEGYKKVVFCGRCDWKLSQVVLGNKYTWSEFAHEFQQYQIYAWGIGCDFDMCAEVKRLKRNRNAQLRREKKKAKEADDEPEDEVFNAFVAKRKERLFNKL